MNKAALGICLVLGGLVFLGGGIGLGGGDEKQINAAIDKGVKYLKTHQNLNGTWGRGPVYAVGYTALPGLTLLESGVSPKDPVVQKAAGFVRSNVSKLTTTYELSLAILFLDRLGEKRDEGLIRKMALRLVAGQTAAGGWDYHVPILKQSEMDQLFALLQKTRAKNSLPDSVSSSSAGANPMPRNLQNIPAVANQGKAKGKAVLKAGRDDNSNSQFAMLALWTARRHGVATDMTLLLAYQRYVTSQKAAGGWGYMVNAPEQTPAMTCVGLLGLAMGHGSAPELDDGKAPKVAGQNPNEDRAIQNGLRALGDYIGQPSPSKVTPPMANLYFLWSVERVAMLYNLKTIGGKDWYGWGVQILVPNQLADGSWLSNQYHGSAPTIDTCFALLFLKRSNLVQDLTENLQLFMAIRDPDAQRK